MFNFLDPKLLPKVMTSSPSTDNYEIDNLLSSDYTKKLRGFIAYPSIKPPVQIDFDFICNISIHCVVINSTVGSQSCSGIELLGKNNNGPYVSIGKAYYDTQGVIFCNVRKYPKDSPPACYNSSYYSLCYFKGNTFKTFLNASSLKLVIFRTQKSVPCIASIEVWGFPSKDCSQKTVNTIFRLMENNAPNGNNKMLMCTNKDEIFQIPDDFKDDLTYELMTIPYTLPSGKTVDQTTLEKHVESEKSFGRKPCDPFTGIKFNDTLKPVLNVGLKSRIDMFLLENSHRSETFGLKRSLGSHVLVAKKARIDNESLKNTATDSQESNSQLDKDDLDGLIRAAQSNSDFLLFTTSNENSVQVCNLCENVFQYLYELPCKHFYCRMCLAKNCDDCKCKKCKQQFAKKDVKKCNL